MKLAMGIKYDGSSYIGWQKQKNLNSVQECIEIALSKVANEKITVYCAGRTDTKVHATGQVIHFNTGVYRSNLSWIKGVNSNLPKDISVFWVKVVSYNFHARFSAISRRYNYIIYNYYLRPAIFRYGMTHYHHYLDILSMTRASKYLLGIHDFTAFRSLKCQSNSPWRNIHHIHISRKGPFVLIDIKANAFVYHMVRNIIGSLLDVGSGKHPEKWINYILKLRDKNKSYSIASPEGLYFTSAEYPLYFAIPQKNFEMF